MTKPAQSLPLKSLPSALRIPVLAILLGGTLVVLGKAIVTPKSSSLAAPALLPQAVPIAGWQPPTITPLPPTQDGIGGQSYQYRPSQPNLPGLQAEIRQIVGDGNVSQFLLVYSKLRQENDRLQERQQAETGVYAVLSHAGRAYLTACINPEGGSTVTRPQFISNRSQNVWQVGRIVPWLMGRGSLSDKRCLWTLMSVPIDRTQPEPVATEAAYKTLETAWVSWYRGWQPNFPPALPQ